MRWLFVISLILNVFPPAFSTNGAATTHRDPDQAAISPGRGSILLLSEINSAKRESIPQGNQQEALPERRVSACFVVGPLASLVVTNQIGNALNTRGYQLQSMWREVEAGKDYWVYLPAAPSVRATSRLIQELSANDLDSFVIPEGELEGSLAVGIFAVESNAARQKNRLVDMGYDAQIQQVLRWNREYWLLSGDVPAGADWQAVVSSLDLENVPQKMSRRSCKTVASAMRFQ